MLLIQDFGIRGTGFRALVYRDLIVQANQGYVNRISRIFLGLRAQSALLFTCKPISPDSDGGQDFLSLYGFKRYGTGEPGQGLKSPEDAWAKETFSPLSFLMALGALPVGPGLTFVDIPCLVAGLAVQVKGGLKPNHLTLLFKRVVALAASLGGTPWRVQVFSVLIDVVAVPAGDSVVFGVPSVGEFDRALTILMIAPVVEDDDIKV